MRIIGSGAMACLVRRDRRSYGRLAMWCPRDNSGEREGRLSTASGVVNAYKIKTQQTLDRFHSDQTAGSA